MANSKDKSSTDSENSSGDVPDSKPSLYFEGEKVLAYHGPRIYEAKVQKAELRKNEWRYFVHYLGWNKNWDEWVGADRLMKLTEDNVLKQQALDKKQGMEKSTKSGRSAPAKPKSSADVKLDKEETKSNVPKGKKRKADSGTEKGNASAEKLVKIQIPSTLKKQLVDDWEFVMHQNKLVKLPRSPTVDDILTKYLEYRSKKDGMMTDSVGEILNGIRCYFDKALSAILLYKKERQQYHEAVSDNVSPSSVYGAEHLLRLFVKLPELLAYAKIEEETLTKLQQKFLDFLKFVQKNQGTFFLSAYDGPKASEGSGINSSIYKSRRRLKVNRNLLLPSLKPKSSISIRSSGQFRGRIIHCSVCSCSHSHQHHSHHDHHHVQDEGDVKLTKFQEVFLKFANAIRWTQLANFLRVNLELCCCSAALFIAAAVCPYFLPKPAVLPFQRVFALIAFPLVGVSASLDALVDITGGKINIHVLMALAAFASVFMGNVLEGGLLLAMFNLAHIAEEYFTSRSKGDVKELKENHPEFALVLHVDNQALPSFSDLSYSAVPVSDLEVGSFILVKAGESVPVDCEVSRGRSTITIEHLTGEVKPLDKKEGDNIPGGARNLDGMLIVKAKKTWKESMLSRIVQLTEEAQLSKPRLQRWLDKFGEQYSKAVVLLSLAVAFLGPFLFKWPFFSTSACRGSIYRALGLMVAASPCALAVAPLAYATAISACAKRGILLKGGQVLDALASCHTIAFDKTGTLTTGEFMCKAIEPIHGHARSVGKGFASCCNPSCEKEALAVAAAMERGTTHPIGRAVVDHSTGKDLPSVSVESFENLPGRGIVATLSSFEPRLGGGKPWKAFLGSVEYITSLCHSEDESRRVKEAVSTSSHGVDFVRAALSVNNQKVTLFHFEDKPRPGVLDVVQTLQNQAKLRVIMLTGDHEASARRVAKAVGIIEVNCSLKPEDKLYHVTSISRDTGGLIMVGDGINDAPALAAATVGIVLAERASAAAIAVADVLLLQDNISGVPFCVAKSRQTTSLIKQNVALALCSIILASLTSVMGFLPLWLTVLLHEGGTLLVCLNSVRALNPPTWSWREDISQIIDSLRSLIMFLRHGTLPSTIQAAHL